MNIPWKLKSLIFGVIDFFDAPRVLYFLQKHVTKRSRVGNLNISPIWQNHKFYLKKYNATGQIFEFGAGKTLAQNLFLSDVIEKQVVVDLNPMIDLDFVEDARRQISKLVDLKSNIKIKTVLKLAPYGIEYRAPYDAAQTDFNEKSIDGCISTNTLEHIPEENIISIFLELHRILKDDGIISASIDYSDHYAHKDKTISMLNYLKFDQNRWKKYNHNCHYQNRLRHYEYLKIFKKCGFIIIEEKLLFSAIDIPPELIETYKNKDETWKATSAHIILKKAIN